MRIPATAPITAGMTPPRTIWAERGRSRNSTGVGMELLPRWTLAANPNRWRARLTRLEPGPRLAGRGDPPRPPKDGPAAAVASPRYGRTRPLREPAPASRPAGAPRAGWRPGQPALAPHHRPATAPWSRGGFQQPASAA